MTIKKPEKLSTNQKSIANNVSKHTTAINWRDHKWQLEHSIKDIATFEKLTEIKFTNKERIDINKTINKFPLSITPYYASLIAADNYQNDPIFRQSFPNPAELKVQRYEMSDIGSF